MIDSLEKAYYIMESQNEIDEDDRFSVNEERHLEVMECLRLLSKQQKAMMVCFNMNFQLLSNRIESIAADVRNLRHSSNEECLLEQIKDLKEELHHLKMGCRSYHPEGYGGLYGS